MDNKEKLTEMVLPKLDELGCFLVDIKAHPAVDKYEVFIDSDEGVTIQTCEKVSRYLQFLMDNDAAFQGNYSLDVSSPGMDNPFKVKRQYTKNIGRMVEVVLKSGVKKEGVLMEANDDFLRVAVHHPPKKKGMKPVVTEEVMPFAEILITKNKIKI